jgi:hypothetical protein
MFGRVCAVEASLAKSRWHRKRGVWLFSRDEPGGRPDYWPGGARREGGVSLVCGSGTEREKAERRYGDRGRRSPRSREGACRGGHPKALSTDAALAGGPACISGEAPADLGWGWSEGAG